MHVEPVPTTALGGRLFSAHDIRAHVERYAGLRARLMAFALDYVLIAGYLLLLAVVSILLAASPWRRPLLDLFAHPLSAELAQFVLLTLPVLLYFALLERSAWQGTWGKRLLGLRVVTGEGGRLGTVRSLARSAGKLVPWELSHALLWRVALAPGGAPVPWWVPAGYALVYALVGVSLGSILLSRRRQTLYDRLAGTVVLTGDAVDPTLRLRAAV